MRFPASAVLNLLFVVTTGAMLLVPAAGLVINTLQAPAALQALLPRDLSPASLATLPEALDQHIAASYGNRDEMIRADAAVKAALGGESRRVAFGTDGFLFLKDDDVFSQVTGQRLDRAKLENFAGLATALNDEYGRDGRRFVAFVAPNKHTIYRRHLPVWARTEPAVTERGLLMDMLRARGVTAVDPTAALAARAESDPVYWRGDTHWTRFGTVIGFDEMVRALGLPAEAIGVDTVFGGQDAVDRPGDLVRIAGLGDSWPDVAPKRIGPDPFSEEGLFREDLLPGQTFGGYRLRHDPPRPGTAGPKVLVLGDSFTIDGFGPMFMRFASQYMWLHHRLGRFDRDLVAEFDPDIVVLEVVERHIASIRDNAEN
ncbi:MAG TPA: hypothetical protein GX405_16650 [Rhizobiales bacterium]|nr:hypothetical protein [Hyphomicrobiales bacterium]